MRCARHGPRKASLNRVPVAASQPFEWLQIDWILGMPATPDRNTSIIVVVDGMTGYVTARAYPVATAAATTEFVINEIIFRYGIPRKIQTDNGSHFQGTFQALCDKWSIKRSWSAAYYPPSHGKVERSNQEVLTRLRKMCDGPHWDRRLGGAVFAINTRRSRRHPVSPAELLYGVAPRGPLEINVLAECGVEEGMTSTGESSGEGNAARLAKLELLRQNTRLQRQKNAQPWTKKNRVNLQPGDSVLYWVERRPNKLAPRWAGPATVAWLGTKGPVGVKLSRKGRTRVFAGHHVKRCDAEPETDAPVAEGRGRKRSTAEISQDWQGQKDSRSRCAVRRPKR